MEKVSIRIDERNILAQKDATVLEVALENNIYIPHLCYHPDLKPAGNCRLCLVETEDSKLVTSCRTSVSEGMVIKTRSPKLDSVRRPIVEMLLANNHLDCRNCAKKGRCELQRIRGYMRIDKKSLQRLRLPKEELPSDVSNPFFERNPNKCVLCGICVRTCQEIQKINAVDFIGRGYTTKIATFGDMPMAQSKCVSCGECVVRCPVGALVAKNISRPSTEVKTICPHCAVGCGIYLGIRDNAIVNVRGDDESPVNEGRLCVKGRFGLGFVHSPERLKSPLIRIGLIKQDKNNPLTPTLDSPLSKGGYRGVKGGQEGFKEVSWDEALEFVAGKLRNYTGKEFALFASPHCMNEDNYIAQKFARVVMGSNHIDNAARLCQGPTISAMLETTGASSIASSFKEIEKTACILAVGANLSNSHPVAGLRIKRAVERGAKLIVINPKEIDLCRIAEVWLRPHPGTDVALLMGICKVIVDEELSDNSFIGERCDNFEDFKSALDDFPLGRVERITGVPRDMVAKAARIYATSKPASILWSAGVTKYSCGTDNVFGLINVALLTGNMRNPKSALHSFWGQSNALGECYMGCLPDFYPGYQAVSSLAVRKKIESFWGKSLNPEPGLTFAEILRATNEGKIKALYIIGSDPVTSVAPTQRVKESLEKAEFIVVQDMFLSETARFAHVIFPAASFAEKEGTFTNTEKRIQRVNKAIEPVGSSRPDWQIICDLAKKLGSRGFDFNNSEEIMSEISSVTLTYGGMSSDSLNKVSTEQSYLGERDRFRFIPLQYRPPAEVSDIEYPLILITERDVYSSGMLSRKVEGLNVLRANGFVHINPKDAADFGITDGEIVKVISRWGETERRAKVTDTSPPGIVIMAIAEKEINQIMNPAHDPIAKTLETKLCAIRIVPQEES